MKFGKTLKRVAYSPWCDHYVDYKALKQLLKRVLVDIDVHFTQSQVVVYQHDTTRVNLKRLPFFQEITLQVLKVTRFYSCSLDDYEQQYTTMTGDVGRLHALCEMLDKLRSFVLLNHLAFIKILKKYDKHASSLTCKALQEHRVSGLFGWRPEGETGSASVTCMETIMRADFYSSPRLALLLTKVQVELAMLASQKNQKVTCKSNVAGKQQDESKESSHTHTDDDVGMEIGRGVDVNEEVNADTDADTMVRPHTEREKQMQRDDFGFTCPICLDVLSLPVVLSCSHKFCFSCLAKWSMQSQRCPVCRLEHPLHPDNYSVDPTLDTFLRAHYGKDKEKREELEVDEVVSNGKTDLPLQISTGEYEDNNDIVVNKSLALPKTYIKTLLPHVVNTLKHVNALLDVANSRSYVVLDIDDTLLTNLYTPCLLTTDKGIQAYHAILSRNPLYALLTLKQRNTVTRILQKALDSKRLVESETAMVVHTLQLMGCKVFALTKRFADSASETRKELLTMGLDVSVSSPFPKGRKYCDECTESLLIDGVIFTNGHEKGPVLDRFLSQIVFAHHLNASKGTHEERKEDATLSFSSASSRPAPTNSQESGESMSHSPSSSRLSSFASMLMSSVPNPFRGRERCDPDLLSPNVSNETPVLNPSTPAISATRYEIPSNLIFVDDLHDNAISVLNDLSLCRALNVPIISCHYTAVKEQAVSMLAHYNQQMFQQFGKHHEVALTQSTSILMQETRTEYPMSQSNSVSTVSKFNGQCFDSVHSDMEILQYQVYHLVHKHAVINDQQARFIITKLKLAATESTAKACSQREDNSTSARVKPADAMDVDIAA